MKNTDTIVENLESGARLAVCEMKGFEGVSFKMFVYRGSRNEKEEKNHGISHLIEHMFFKGTKKRSVYDIVKELDKLGIQTNAYTSKDTTCYYTYGTNDTLEKSVEIYSDMLFNSTFDSKELEREKQVVVEEIMMYDDKPDAVCEMALDKEFYKNTSYAHDIAGTKESVLNITREQILKYYKKHYLPKNIIFSFAGDVTLKQAKELVNKYFESNFKKNKQQEVSKKLSNFKVKQAQVKTKKDVEQAQILLAYKTGNNLTLKQKVLASFISTILGGGMSSRLFQEVREKLGLVYSIFSYHENYDLGSRMLISLGTTPKKVTTALKTIKRVINDVLENGFTEEELKQVKNMSISKIKLQSDSPSNMASLIANCLRKENEIYNKEDRIKLYKSITLEEVNQTAKEIFNHNNLVISLVSRNTNVDLIDEYLR